MVFLWFSCSKPPTSTKYHWTMTWYWNHHGHRPDFRELERDHQGGASATRDDLPLGGSSVLSTNLRGCLRCLPRIHCFCVWNVDDKWNSLHIMRSCCLSAFSNWTWPWIGLITCHMLPPIADTPIWSLDVIVQLRFLECTPAQTAQVVARVEIHWNL